MGLFDRVERKLESAVNGAFARVFRAEVQPVEIASAMRRAMDDRAATVARQRMTVPNIFVVDLSPTDFERLMSYEDELVDELIASAEEHAEQQGYVPGGPLDVQFRRRDDLETGLFTVHASTARRQHAIDDDLEAQEAERARRRSDHEAELRRAHPFRPPEAEAPAQGAAGLASAAASAAAGSLASTAAAARSGGLEFAPSEYDEDQHDVFHGMPPTVDPATRPWLDGEGEHYPLLGAVTILGRDTTADITLPDGGVSRRHAEIRVTPDGPHLVVTVVDLGSTNGTFVNGERVTSQHVHDGDRITVGRTSLTLRAGRGGVR